jgi:hypothetical protein
MPESTKDTTPGTPPQPELRQSPPALPPSTSHRGRLRAWIVRGFSFFAALGVIAGLIMFLDWCRDQYEALRPEINPDPVATSASSSPFLLFSISNRSKLVDFYHVEVGCNFHIQVFGNEKYKVIIEGKAVDPGFDPKDRDVTLRRGKPITFPCDPTMEPVPLTFNYDVLRNLSAELYLTVKYSVHAIFFDWSRTYRSPTFHCVNPGSGLRCTEAEAVLPDLPIMPPRK